jgi:hypothetical protein
MKGKLKVLSIILTLGLLLVGCSEETQEDDSVPRTNEPVITKKEEPKKEEPKQEEPQIQTKVFAYAKKVDITDAIEINKHVTATVFMSEELTPQLATQHVLNQSYDFLQQEDLAGANTVTIGVMHGETRVFQFTVDKTKFTPNETEPMVNVVLQASKVEKSTPEIDEYATAVNWNIIK